MSLRSVVALSALAGWALAVVPSASAQDPTAGRVRLGGQEVAFGPPVALWDQENNYVAFAFFTTPPAAEAIAAAREAGEWDVRSTGPAVVLELEFTPGAAMVMVDQLESCRLTFHGFPEPLELSGGAAECHMVSVGGLLARFGSVIGLLEGEGASYALRLPFAMSVDELTTPAGETASTPEPGLPPLPANTVEGRARYDGQQVNVTHGLAWWDAGKAEVRMALFANEPPPGMLADLRAGSWGEGGPVVQVHLEVSGGAPATVSSVTYCYLSTSFPQGGSISLNTDAKGCGVADLGGEIAAGGRVTARLRGEGSGPADKVVSWELRLNLPIAP